MVLASPFPDEFAADAVADRRTPLVNESAALKAKLHEVLLLIKLADPAVGASRELQHIVREHPAVVASCAEVFRTGPIASSLLSSPGAGAGAGADADAGVGYCTGTSTGAGAGAGAGVGVSVGVDGLEQEHGKRREGTVEGERNAISNSVHRSERLGFSRGARATASFGAGAGAGAGTAGERFGHHCAAEVQPSVESLIASAMATPPMAGSFTTPQHELSVLIFFSSVPLVHLHSSLCVGGLGRWATTNFFSEHATTLLSSSSRQSRQKAGAILTLLDAIA
jgi:hypothetical protein